MRAERGHTGVERGQRERRKGAKGGRKGVEVRVERGNGAGKGAK